MEKIYIQVGTYRQTSFQYKTHKTYKTSVFCIKKSLIWFTDNNLSTNKEKYHIKNILILFTLTKWTAPSSPSTYKYTQTSCYKTMGFIVG